MGDGVDPQGGLAGGSGNDGDVVGVPDGVAWVVGYLRRDKAAVEAVGEDDVLACNARVEMGGGGCAGCWGDEGRVEEETGDESEVGKPLAAPAPAASAVRCVHWGPGLGPGPEEVGLMRGRAGGEDEKDEEES